MKANRFDQALSQIPKEWGVSIPDSIAEGTESYFHVIMIKRTHIPAEETYKTVSYVQQYPQEAWLKKGGVKDNLPLLGYNKAYILHDPTVKVVAPKEEKKPAGRPKKQIEAED